MSRWLTFLPLAVIALPLLAPDGAAQRGGRRRLEAIPYHDGTLEEALRECRERNTPMLVLCCLEGEEANDRFREQLRDNSAFAEKLGNTLPLLVNNGTHRRRTIARTGPDGERERVEVCAQYHTDTCEVHKRNWDAVYQTFLAERDDGAWPLPSALIIDPAGELEQVIAHAQPPGESEMLRALDVARAKAGPSISRDELREVKSLTKEGEAMASARAWPQAWHAWNGILSITEYGQFADRAKEQRAAAEVGMKKRLEELAGETDDPNRRYPILAEFAFHAVGTPVEEPAEDAVADLEQHPDIDEEMVEQVELELEAAALLREARKLLRAGEEREAKRALRKLGRRKYEGTPARAEAIGEGLLEK